MAVCRCDRVEMDGSIVLDASPGPERKAPRSPPLPGPLTTEGSSLPRDERVAPSAGVPGQRGRRAGIDLRQGQPRLQSRGGEVTAPAGGDQPVQALPGLRA